MKTETESTSMQTLPNQNFRFGVLATDTRHTLMALRWCKNVWHGKRFYKFGEIIITSPLFDIKFHVWEKAGEEFLGLLSED